MQSLRGAKAKEKFMRDYMNIKVLAYRVLLNGDMRKNQCGGKLTDRYYHFTAIHKNTLKKENFFLGYDCARQLMKMLDIPIDSIKLFNPFKQEYSEREISSGSYTSCNNRIYFTALGRELFDLINLIWIGLSLQDIDILHDIQNKLYENPDKEPPPSHFKSLNTILNKWNTTIQSIIAKLQQNNRNFRNFDFTQAREYLKEYFEKNNINDTIRF